jgi:hypothetical protein
VNFEVSREVSVVVEGARTQLAFPRLRGVGVCSLVLGEVCVAGE